MVKYSYYIARISSFIASKMQSSVTKNLVFPSCGDIKILHLLVSWFPSSFLKAAQSVLAILVVSLLVIIVLTITWPPSRAHQQ